MKKLIVLLMLFVATICKGNGFTIWGLTEQDISGSQNAMSVRIGYQYESIEAFLGSTWRPNYDTDTGEIEPPQVFSLGTVIHWKDLIDPDNPLPFIPDLLLKLIPENMVAQPYFGGQATFNLFEHDAGFYGAIIGLQCKTDIKNKSAFIVELDYNDNFKDLSAVPDNKFRLNMGFRFLF